MERDNSSDFGPVVVASTLWALMAAQPDPWEACSYIQRRKAKISKNHLICRNVPVEMCAGVGVWVRSV